MVLKTSMATLLSKSTIPLLRETQKFCELLSETRLSYKLCGVLSEELHGGRAQGHSIPMVATKKKIGNRYENLKQFNYIKRYGYHESEYQRYQQYSSAAATKHRTRPKLSIVLSTVLIVTNYTYFPNSNYILKLNVLLNNRQMRQALDRHWSRSI